MKNLRISHFIPISLLITLVIIVILYFCKLEFLYFLYGVLLSLFSHFMMLIQNRQFYNISKNRSERQVFHPKKSSVLWYIFRIIIVGGFVALICFLSNIPNGEKSLEMVILMLSGYVFIKVIFIVFILIIKKEGGLGGNFKWIDI